jgi:hypothetical protein
MRPRPAPALANSYREGRGPSLKMHDMRHQTRFQSLAAVAVLAALAAGCADREAPSATGPTSATTDRWLGQWNGPEGTFLRIESRPHSYRVTIQNLDGPRSFEGSAVGNRIQFVRDGVTETLRASNGAETGMKWLSEKRDCLTVKTGEGYCRD